MNPQQRRLKIATLNYSGIITSPYEYHEDEDDEKQKQINDVFTDVVKRYHADNFEDAQGFKWEMGNVDVVWKSRNSPVNKLMCGVKQGEQRVMMKLSQFEEEWDAKLLEFKDQLSDFYHNKFKKSKSSEEITQMMNTHIQNTKKFDILAYRTFAQIIYGTEDIENWEVNADQWIEYRKSDFEKSYLDEEKKIAITLDVLKRCEYDIFCFQETNENFVSTLKEKLSEYWLCENQKVAQCSSIIVLKKSTFPEIQSKNDLEEFNHDFFEEYCQVKAIFHAKTKPAKGKTFFQHFANQKQIEELRGSYNWNNDTVMQVVDRLVIFCPHISSKKQFNSLQIQKMKKDLQNLKKYNPEYSFICTGDYNSAFVKQFQMRTIHGEMFTAKMFPPPGSQQHITCNKKRTLLQPQRHKAEKHDLGTKDYMITDMELGHCQIMMINGKEIGTSGKKDLLPNDKHPFDHYVTSCEAIFVKHDDDDNGGNDCDV